MHDQRTRALGFGPGITDEHDAEPSAAELAEIECEWSLIAAELDLLDAEITALSAEGHASKLDRRRVRRAERRVLEVSRELAAEGVSITPGEAVA
ncbi:DUF6284 family protein [Actinoallomurus sp. NPDC052308]|uniref:DUF6284 family protein n=1 Tax=Actinoallomurus sp. NPDC052308 TaxID=3155530 RepID=UPI0034316ABF